jgi:hypothetical protein
VVLIAEVTEWLFAALGSAIITNRGSTVSASRNSWLAAANCVPTRAVFEFDLAGWKHLPGILAEERTKGGRKHLYISG